MRRLGPSALENRAVRLWIVRLEASADNFARSLSSLSPEEKGRAERFRFDRHRRAFVLGRAALRALLGSYLGIANADVKFVYGRHGKPALADPESPLRFNASNSGNLAAYAFTYGCEIGVDLEQYRALSDIENIARRFFSPEETAELLGAPESERIVAFFNCWTRKEAYIKAMGGGLSIPLDSFRVALLPGVAPEMLSLEGSVDAARRWTLCDFTPAQDYAGAIAYAGQPRLVLSGETVSLDELFDI
ncbi:MAG: 4'-phosphopantetheinyl transferase superfamily protein [Bryobacterales bacterium]|nr:4'-phosphopantetheinyl transferase superfamily protein [Bryobacterales bacterium]